MTFLIIIIILLSLLTLLESVNKRIIPTGTGIVVFFILFFLAATRPIGLDNDSGTYIYMFNNFNKPIEYFRNWGTWGFFEPFYYLIPSVLHYVFQVPQFDVVTLYVYAFLGCGIIMLVVRQFTDYYYAAILTLFCHYFLLQQMTQIRAAIAVGIFLFCIKLKVEKKWLLFAVCVFISFLFHYSSLLTISLLFVSEKSQRKTLLLSLVILSFLLSFIDFSWVIGYLNFGDAGALAQKQDVYILDVRDELLNRRSYIFCIHVVNTLILICFGKQLYVHNKYVYLMAKLQVVGLLIFQVFSASPAISSRSADIFLSTHIITLSASLYLFKYKFWPAIMLCILNTAILLTLIYRNHIFQMEYLPLL
jgi:hypothetical protein